MNTSIKSAIFFASTLALSTQTIAQETSTGNIFSPLGDEIANYTLVHPTCSGESDGIIKLNILDQGVKLIWEDESEGDGLERDGLTSGNYEFKLLNSDYSLDYKLSLTDPQELTANINLLEKGNTYLLDLEINGGFGPYSQVWNTGSLSEDLHNVSKPGNYEVSVMDKNGCKTNASIFVDKFTDPVSDNNQNLKIALDHTDGLLNIKGSEIQKVVVQHESGAQMPQIGDQVEYGVFRFRLPLKGMYVITIYEDDQVTQKKIFK